MNQTDIVSDKLAILPQEDADYLISLINTVPDFPKEHILFRDFTPILRDARGLQLLVKALIASLPVAPDEIDVIAGMESRGFLAGIPLAYELGKSFVPVRKAGKLPPPVFHEEYALEYGTASLEISTNALSSGQRVYVIDDLIATGGTAVATATLIESAGATVAGFGFIMELQGLQGREALSQYPVSSLMKMPA